METSVRPLTLLLLLSLSGPVAARDKAHVTGTFVCSVGQWLPSTTHLRFWDKGRVFDNTLQ